jgi:hypothetical protein
MQQQVAASEPGLHGALQGLTISTTSRRVSAPGPALVAVRHSDIMGSAVHPYVLTSCTSIRQLPDGAHFDRMPFHVGTAPSVGCIAQVAGAARQSEAVGLEPCGDGWHYTVGGKAPCRLPHACELRVHLHNPLMHHHACANDTWALCNIAIPVSLGQLSPIPTGGVAAQHCGYRTHSNTVATAYPWPHPGKTSTPQFSYAGHHAHYAFARTAVSHRGGQGLRYTRHH